MKKEGKVDGQRPFKLAHQTLCIRAINFNRRSVVGYVELAIHPLVPNLRRVKINSKQCRIYQVTINEQWDARFLYNDPSLEICQGDAKQRNLDYFQNFHLTSMTTVDPDTGNGEVTIRMPPESHPLISELRPFKVCIEFSLEQPKGGIHFVTPNMEGTPAERSCHLFTYKSLYENSSRMWFPCIDTFSELCTWKIEITTEMDMTAVSCGDLIEVMQMPDRKSKTFHYFLSTPTAAPNIAMAVGPFEILVDPNMHEVTHFCLPHLTEILKHTTGYIHEAFEFYEELLSSRYPYSCYKQVFVDESFIDMDPYATMTVFSTNLLHSSRIINQTIETRTLMAAAVAEQFFGCFLSMASWPDAWLTVGIAKYLAGLFIKNKFGNNEYRYLVSKEMKLVQDYEHRVGGIVLDPAAKHGTHHFFVWHRQTISPKYAEIFQKKAHLILRMFEIRIGQQLLIQVLNKLLALAVSSAQQKFLANTWGNTLLSTSSFTKIISTVTGKDIQPFLDLWVSQSGCARFFGSFVFNRKRNVVELEIKQDLSAKGALKYVGPLTVTIQELDGSFNHTFKIEENKTKFDITCHSKSRRNKKKKIPLVTGEEVDMDLSAMDADSPVLWLQIDPKLELLRQVTFEQPDYMWQYQLRYERDVVSQKEAIAALEHYPSPATRKALTDVLENEHCFYKVRIDSAQCLAKVANSMVTSWAGPPAMMTIFRKIFGSHSCPAIIRQNNFSNFQHYFLLKTIPRAMAHLRNLHAICPPEVFEFIMGLFKYNDNSRNKYSDCYYRASLIDAAAATITPAITIVGSGQGLSTDSLTTEAKRILEEITRCLNLEKLLPCYRHVVTVSCLKAIRILQKNGHLTTDSTFFINYAQYGVFRDVRITALECLVDVIKTDLMPGDLYWLLDLIESDRDKHVCHIAMRQLIDNPPFKRQEHNPLHTEDLVERLWKMMNSTLSHDSRLRCDVADLYFTLYGRTRPTCLVIPDNLVVLNLKDKKTRMNPAIVPEELEDMFESDDDDDMNLNSSMNAAESDDKEINVMDVSPLKDDVSLKRKSDMAFDLMMSDHSMVTSLTHNEDSNSEFKFKLKIAYKNCQFMKVPIVKPEEDITVASSFTKDTDRLSDDSMSPSQSSSAPASAVTSQPTSFSGLFSSVSMVDSVDHSKLHKVKKKKKKNKKHKHKHRHEKSERDTSVDRFKDSEQESVLSLDRFKEGHKSSESSTVNSPSVFNNPPSSPEFEVI
ncbi:transcription initiation factor TFIID subunit 2-like isoform X2 [Mytilus galloprovincialis]|uniref:transcription initiation factor TFIID subunit 2-like isoform X2 n=1 Tax=Mytilus galloprovincialis TaxID=29158 RepID=UPI003F7BBF32